MSNGCPEEVVTVHLFRYVDVVGTIEENLSILHATIPDLLGQGRVVVAAQLAVGPCRVVKVQHAAV